MREQSLIYVFIVPALVGLALFFVSKYFDPLAWMKDGFFKSAWGLFIAAGLLLLSAHLTMSAVSRGKGTTPKEVTRTPALPDSENDEPEASTPIEEQVSQDESSICGKPLENFALLSTGVDWGEPVEYNEYFVRYRSVPSSSLKLDRREALIVRQSDKVVVAQAEVMNLHVGCYWDWADSTRMLSLDDDSECALEDIFDNAEIREVFPRYRHYTFLGLASKPGTEFIDYLKLTRYRADNLLKAAARSIPESLRKGTTPLVLGIGRNLNTRRRGSIAEKRERSAYLIGVRECMAAVGDQAIAAIVLNTAEVSGVRFTDYSHTPATVWNIKAEDYDSADPFVDWKTAEPKE